MASNLGYTLGTFALQNSPTMIGRQKRMGIGAMLGFDGSKDPNKSIIAQQAPSALSNPEAHIGDIIGGAIAKTPMSLSGAKTADPTVDTSSLGSFGDVNSSAGTDVTGAQSKTTKGNFWDSKGGGILSSLLGVLALGGLGAGIGAISGGGKGALQGASYGMGFGALQDLALRKSAMEGAANEEKLDFERAKLADASKPDMVKTMEWLKANQGGNADINSIAQQAYDISHPYAAEDRAFKQQQADFGNQLRLDSQQRLKEDLERKRQENLDKQTRYLSDDLRTTQAALGSFENINKQLGFNIDNYNEKTGKVEIKDPKTGKTISSAADIPGVSIPGYGRSWSVTGEARKLGADVQQLMSLQIYDRTGKAINIPELENFKFELGQGKLNTESDFLTSYKKAKKAIERKLENIKAGYSADVVSEYEGRGGKTIMTPTNGDPMAIEELRRRGLVK